jgi:very-short-patch-repair endonuclease/uncharacterized Zn finger protein (UPF0148 family)
MTRKAPPFTDADRAAIAQRYVDGEGLVVLARSYGCRYQKIKDALMAVGIEPKRTATVNTPIECRLHDALKVAGVGFTTQVRLVGRYVVDVRINQAPVVIEADGMRHRVGEAQERDAARDAAHEAAGYRVFRFTGSELNSDAAACVQRVIEACGLTPDEDPVYDIRTSFSGPDHPRWSGRMVEISCEHCGVVFTARKGRRFCNPECYRLYARETGMFKGKPKSAGTRAKIGEANRRRVVSEETRAKISAARKGKPTTKGVPKSAEHRAKISAALMGHIQSDETRAKKSRALKGNSNARKNQIKI